ncbi:MAG: hypothetical protein PHE53_06075 [Thermoguttaceae bacterium]|nr:hypothetical protein [Thermoguttaceae bacterium]
MALFEVETEGHIMITCAETEADARNIVQETYPGENPIRVSKRPRDSFVISKAALGIVGKIDVCHVAREALAKAAGDKIRAIRIYMHETGADLEQSRKVIESNILAGW